MTPEQIEAAAPATTIAALRADLAAKDAEIARLREAMETLGAFVPAVINTALRGSRA